MKYKGIVFDKDGTLIDFHATWSPTYHFASIELAKGNSTLAAELLTQHGYDAITQRFMGGSLLAAGNNEEIAQAWSKQLPDIANCDSDKEYKVLAHRLHDIFVEQGRINSTAVPDLKRILKQLKTAGLKLGVATADSYQGILNTLGEFDVIKDFDFLCGYDSGHGTKPEAGMVLAFCQSQSLNPSDVVVVGDNSHDIEMGRNANAGLCVGVLTGTSTRNELEKIADIVLNDIRELPALLD
ncbi:MAG: phosphoglycolate phosphatase [Gammaproteobacteria bacterium]|jgi:phosphoglycolate phosphatase